MRSQAMWFGDVVSRNNWVAPASEITDAWDFRVIYHIVQTHFALCGITSFCNIGLRRRIIYAMCYEDISGSKSSISEHLIPLIIEIVKIITPGVPNIGQIACYGVTSELLRVKLPSQ